MKTVYQIIALLLSGALIFGCTPTPADPENPDTPVKPTPEPAVSMTLTFVLPAAPSGGAPALVKDKWVAGDKIVVHGEYATEQVEVTLAAGDIDASGKKATVTVDGLHPYKSDERTCTLYASYPASAVSNPRHCFCYSGFGNENTMMMAAYNDGETFNFVTISSALRFRVSGDFDAYTLATRKGATLMYDYYQVKLTDTDTNLKQYTQSPRTEFSSSVVYADGKTENYLYIAGDISLPDGFSITFTKKGETVKTYFTKSAAAAAAGRILDLGDLTPYLAGPVDTDSATPLDNIAPANCYIVTKPGTYKFAGIMGNDKTAVLKKVESVELLWETWNNTDSVTVHSVLESVDYDSNSDQVLIKTPATLHPGNALVAAKDDEGKVLWSWHIWVPETEIKDVDAGFAAAAPIMDRNLGALVIASTDAFKLEALGMYYQWGRKDPLCGTHISAYPSDAMKHYVAGAAANYEASIENPTLFYYIESSNWFMGDAISDLWDAAGSKTKYDPCPPGYRVPPFDKTRPLWYKAGATASVLTIDESKQYFTIAPGSTVLVMGGYLNGNNQSESGYGKRGHILSATASDATKANCALIRDGAYNTDAHYKSCGGNIRCMKEE